MSGRYLWEASLYLKSNRGEEMDGDGEEGGGLREEGGRTLAAM